MALVTFFALSSSWFNWGFSLIFSAVLAREVARRVEGVDYRALAAASFLGLGSIWAQGLSGSAALQMATPGALQPQIRDIVASGGIVPGGIIPFRHTIFLWQSLVSVLVEIVVVTLVMWLATPPRAEARTAADLGIDLERPRNSPPPVAGPRFRRARGSSTRRSSPADRRRVGVVYLVRYFVPRRRAAECDQPQHRQPLVSAARLPAAPHAGAADARRAGRHAGGVGRDPAVSVLRGHRGIITSTHLNEQLANALRQHVDADARFRRWWRSIRRCWACSCRQADRSG